MDIFLKLNENSMGYIRQDSDIINTETLEIFDSNYSISDDCLPETFKELHIDILAIDENTGEEDRIGGIYANLINIKKLKTMFKSALFEYDGESQYMLEFWELFGADKRIVKKSKEYMLLIGSINLKKDLFKESYLEGITMLLEQLLKRSFKLDNQSKISYMMRTDATSISDYYIDKYDHTDEDYLLLNTFLQKKKFELYNYKFTFNEIEYLIKF